MRGRDAERHITKTEKAGGEKLADMEQDEQTHEDRARESLSVAVAQTAQPICLNVDPPLECDCNNP